MEQDSHRKLTGWIETIGTGRPVARSASGLDRATHSSRARHLEKSIVAVLPEAVVPPIVLGVVSGRGIIRHLDKRDRGICPFQVNDTRLDIEESGANQRAEPCATQGYGAIGESARIPGSRNRRALAKLMRTFGITSDRAGLGLCPGATLIAGVSPEPLFDLDFFRTRHRMNVRERQAIKARQFNIHLLQLGVATDKLLHGGGGPGAIEAGRQDRRSPGHGTKVRRRARAGGEEGGQKGREHFHAGFTRIIS